MTALAVLAFTLLLQGAQTSLPTAPESTQSAAAVESPIAKLKSVRRIYVDSFGESTLATQIQAAVIASLAESKRFLITENKDKADAILRGTALESSSLEYHSNTEETATPRAAISDSTTSTETVNYARLSVRLVSSDGDVIWATTQESRGAKYKGASADVADKIVKRLLHELERFDKLQDGEQAK